jgi:hypothetical protein
VCLRSGDLASMQPKRAVRPASPRCLVRAGFLPPPARKACGKHFNAAILRAMSKASISMEEAARAGFDVSLIEANLSYSYEKRVLLHDAALELALECERAGRRFRGEAESAPPVPLRR